MEPHLQVFLDDFFHCSFCGKVFGVAPGVTLSPSMVRSAAGTGGGRLHISFLNLAAAGC